MTAKEIRTKFLEQCNGDKRMATNLYEQIKKTFYKYEKLPLNTITYISIVRNDYLDASCKEDDNKVVHIEYSYLGKDKDIWNTSVETCIPYLKEEKIMNKKVRLEELKDKEFYNDSFRIDCVSKTHFTREIGKKLEEFSQFLSIEKVELKLFFNQATGANREYIKVTYVGGGYAVKNNLFNSVSATYRVIGDLINGGYYDEIMNYRTIVESDEWIEIIVD